MTLSDGNAESVEYGDTKTDAKVNLAIAPLPFSSKADYKEMPQGLSVGEMLDLIDINQVRAGMFLVIHINGVYLPNDKIYNVYPNAGTHVVVKAVPHGGDGKNPLATILSIVVLIAAPYLTPIIAPGLAAGSIGAQLLTAGIGIVGRLAVNALIKPPKPGQLSNGSSVRDSSTYSISGARNDARLFGPVPQILGRHRCIPPYAMQPYTQISGNDQYLITRFAVSKGPAGLDTVYIGETEISLFEEAQLELLEGFDDDPESKIAVNDVFELNISIKVERSSGRVIRTTQPDTDYALIDLTLPQGLIEFNDEGDKLSKTVNYTIEYRAVGDVDWTAGETNVSKSAQTFTPAIGERVKVYTPFGVNGTEDRNTVGGVYIDRSTGNATLTTIRSSFNPFIGEQIHESIIPPGAYRVGGYSRDPDGITTVTNSRLQSSNFVDPVNDFVLSVNGSNQIVIAAGEVILEFAITGRSAQTIRRSNRIDFPTNGQYEIAIFRQTADNTSTKIFNDLFWTSLKSVAYRQVITEPNVATVGARIRASNQLNGVIDTLNVVAYCIGKGWDRDAQIWRDNSFIDTPGELIRYVLQGPSAVRVLPDSRINLTSLEEFTEWCEDNNYTYNQYIDFSIGLGELLEQIASAGRGSISYTDGKLGVIIDKPQPNIIQHFTPRNSNNFKGTQIFAGKLHALRVRFPNEDMNFQQDERLVYNDGYNEENATEIEELELPGVTNPDQVWKLGRYYIAVNELRPATYTFETDLEHLVCTRGDRIKLSHDVPLFGSGYGRIKSLTLSGSDITDIELDDGVAMDIDKNYIVRVRDELGESFTFPIVNNPGFHTSIELETPTDQGSILVGDLSLFGENGIESEDLIIKTIRPKRDLKAEIECVNYAPGVFTADTDSIPDFNSNITLPLGLDVPSFGSIVSDETVLDRNPDGTFTSRIFVPLTFVSNRPLHKLASLEAQYRVNVGANEYINLPTLVPEASSFFIAPVDDGVTYTIRLRYRFKSGEVGPWTSTNHVVIGASSPPPPLDSFIVNELGDGTRQFNFSLAAKPPDWDGAEIRYVLGSESDYENMTNLVEGVNRVSPFETTLPLIPGTYSFGAESVDLNKNKSGTPLIVQDKILGVSRLGESFYTEDILQSGFLGTKTNCQVDADSGRLVPISADIWSDFTTWADLSAGWANDFATQIVYEHTIVDIGSLRTLTPIVTVLATGTITIEERHSTALSSWDDYTDWASMGTWDGTTSFSSYAAITVPFDAEQVQIRVTVDNPDEKGIQALILSLL